MTLFPIGATVAEVSHPADKRRQDLSPRKPAGSFIIVRKEYFMVWRLVPTPPEWLMISRRFAARSAIRACGWQRQGVI